MQQPKLFAVILLLLITCGCISHYKTTGEKIVAVKNTSSLDNGKNLTYNICGGCHYNKAAEKFIGKQMHDLPSFMGKVYSANLTHSSLYSVMPSYSDAALIYLLRTGIARDGRYIPYMVRPNISDEDINDIIIYLRSNDAAVAATDTSVGKTHVNGLGKLATSITGKPLPYNAHVKKPATSDPVATGRYLVDNLGCFHCHSKSILGLNYMEPEKSKGYMAGGMKFKMKDCKVYASNLTPCKETGIGNYTVEDFRKAVSDGVAPSGRHLKPPMPQMHELTNAQSDAIYSYLRTLAPKHHKVKGH